MRSLCGGQIEFGNASAGGGFVSKIDGKETDPPQHFFNLVLDDQMVLCYADEHRFGGIVYNVTTRTREEAERMIREAKAAAEEPQRSQRRRQWARELQALNEMNVARYARGCAGGQREEDAGTGLLHPCRGTLRGVPDCSRPQATTEGGAGGPAHGRGVGKGAW